MAGGLLQPFAHALVLCVELWQAQRGDEGADQALARQVDAFAKRPTEHRKTDALAAVDEAGHEGVAVGLGHGPGL